MNKKITLLLVSVLLISGCSIIQFSKKTPPKTAPSGLLHKTINGGDTWNRSDELYALKGVVSRITYSAITFMKSDPLDPNTIYVGTDKGLYYSFNRGDGWFQTLQQKGVVNDIAFDPSAMCTLYAAVHDKVFKTTTCGRRWDPVLLSSLQKEFFKSIHVNASDARVVYVGNSAGALLESRDGGASWEVKQYLSSPIERFLQHPYKPEVFYIVTAKQGIQRTQDGGTNWTVLNDLPVHTADGSAKLDTNGQPVLLKHLKGSSAFYDIVFDRSQKEGLLYSSAYGIFRLINGEYWQEIEVLTKPTQLRVYAVTADRTNGDILYFVTDGRLFKSVNGGHDWTVKQLPVAGNPKFMLLQGDNANEILISFFVPPPKD